MNGGRNADVLETMIAGCRMKVGRPLVEFMLRKIRPSDSVQKAQKWRASGHSKHLQGRAATL